VLGRLGVATARAFGWGLAAGVCRVSHCVCPVDSSKARIRKAGDSREVLYRVHMYCSTSCTQYGMRNLAFFRGAFFADTTISRLPFVTWETAATPAQNFSVTPSTAPGFR
jgi:hypothetical protein